MCLLLIFSCLFPLVASLNVSLRSCTTNPDVYPSHWVSQEKRVNWNVTETALVIVDMWDSHWCDIEVKRALPIAFRINKTATALREMGVQIIHSPSDCADKFYATHPARLAVTRHFGSYANSPIPWSMENASMPPIPENFVDPPGPLGISVEQGCDGIRTGGSWYRQSEVITIDGNRDFISAEPGQWPERSQELLNVLTLTGIRNVLIAGVATNMCIMNRPFGIKALKTMGFNVALIRELTDTMFDPVKDTPYVSHDMATELQIGFIERMWVPTVSVLDLFYR